MLANTANGHHFQVSPRAPTIPNNMQLSAISSSIVSRFHARILVIAVFRLVVGASSCLLFNGDAAMQLAEQCEARGGRTLASFVGTGRGGLPAGPEDPMPAYYQAGVSTGGATPIAAESTDADTDLIRFKAYAQRIKAPDVANQTAAVPGSMALSCGT